MFTPTGSDSFQHTFSINKPAWKEYGGPSEKNLVFAVGVLVKLTELFLYKAAESMTTLRVSTHKCEYSFF